MAIYCDPPYLEKGAEYVHDFCAGDHQRLAKALSRFAKARVVLGAFFGEFDQRLKATEESGLPPLSNFEWWNRLTKYEGYYPASVRAWMEERGYKVPPC